VRLREIEYDFQFPIYIPDFKVHVTEITSRRDDVARSSYPLGIFGCKELKAG
jgi:hypothetical protein